MGNVLVVIVLLVIVFFAVRSSVKHFKGEGDCCGGGGGTKVEIPIKELQGEKLGEFTLHIPNMHCDNCVRSVTKAINSVEGASASVDLKKKIAVVSYDREVSEDRIKAAVKLAGFEVRD